MPPIVHSFIPFFRSGINMRNYSTLAAATKVKTIGMLPNDLLKIVTKSSEDGLSKNLITYLNSTYGEAAKILKKIEKAEMQAFCRIPATDKKFIEIYTFAKKGKIKSAQELFGYEDSLFRERQSEYLLQAEDSLIKRLTTIIPDLKNIILTPLGEGNFKRAYKMEFKFADANKTIAPQVLGVFRDERLSVATKKIYLRFFHNISNKTLSGIFSKKLSINKVKKGRNDLLKSYHEAIERENRINYGQYGHGALAEANTSEYIRYISGHKVNPKDGIVLPDFYSLDEKNPFVVSRFVGKGDKTKNAFDFTILGLKHTDLTINPNNSINGICTDIGGIRHFNGEQTSAIVGSKLGTKISKHFERLPKQEREKYLEELIDNSSNQKNLIDRENTLKAVEEIIETRHGKIY